MSNSVSSVDVEDVLSSIRRLVSDDSKAPEQATDTEDAAPAPAEPVQDMSPEPLATEPEAPAVPDDAAPDVPAEQPGDRLLLTDALRVEDSAEAESDTDAETAADPIAEAPSPDAPAEMRETVQDGRRLHLSATAAPADVESTSDTAPGLDAGFEDASFDEEALRELVAEVVREELRGELGERITRNVKKLVRREIHRALASREFE